MSRFDAKAGSGRLCKAIAEECPALTLKQVAGRSCKAIAEECPALTLKQVAGHSCKFNFITDWRFDRL